MLTTPDAAERHYWPDVLPSGRAVLFTIVRAVTETGETSDLAVLDLETGEQRVLLQGGTHPRYLSSGHLVYSVASTLRAVRFDADRLDVVSGPIPVLERVVTTSQGGTHVDLSDTGTLVYQRSAGVDARTLVWVDRQGNEEPVAAEPRPYDSVRLSPDGRRILTQVNDPSNVDIFIFDLARDTPTRFTTDAGFDGFPIWMPNGERVVFASQRETAGENQLFWRMADGTGDVERLMAGGVPVSVSPDGRTLVLVENHPETDADIGILSMDGEPTVEWLLQEEFNEISPEVSPDGRWRISRDGGGWPLWGPDSDELFYQRLSGRAAAGSSTATIMVTAVETGPTFSSGNPVTLFAGPYRKYAGGRPRPFDIAPEGHRFLMIREEPPTAESPGQPDIVVILNWAEELTRLFPD